LKKDLLLVDVRKGYQFFNGRYIKGIPFSSEVVYERVRGWTMGWNLCQAGLLVESKIPSNGDE